MNQVQIAHALKFWLVMSTLIVSDKLHKITFVSGATTVNYSNGWRDLCTIFFYSMCWIVVHAVIQEYILDVKELSTTHI